jgi:hypothetical protein
MCVQFQIGKLMNFLLHVIFSIQLYSTLKYPVVGIVTPCRNGVTNNQLLFLFKMITGVGIHSLKAEISRFHPFRHFVNRFSQMFQIHRWDMYIY